MTPVTPLVRSRLAQALQHRIAQPHAGLLLTRGWKEYVKGEGDEGQAGKAAHIDRVCHEPPSRLYELAYARWLKATIDARRFRSLYTELQHRMFIGLTAGAAIETGVCSSHSYGMPMIPGSSVKGCARGYAQKIGMEASYRAALFGEDPEAVGHSGRQPGAGCLVWHDAWWTPRLAVRPYVREVVTVHHPDYYAGNGAATDFDSPVPNAQIAVQGGFYFVVEGDPAWAELAIKLLKAALADTGMGAKRAAGYGFMAVDQQATDKARAAGTQAREQTLSAQDKVRSRLSDMDEKTLADKFGVRLNATRNEYEADEWALVPQMAQELYSARIESWAGETKKTNKSRFKARRFFLGLKAEE
jgi:CRISPR-associated protein Cmr6